MPSTTGDLVFDGPFGMTASGRDSAQMVKSRKAAIESYGLEKAQLEYTTIPAVKTINERSVFAISVAVLPDWWRPLVKKLPWYHGKSKSMENITTLAVTEPSATNGLLGLTGAPKGPRTSLLPSYIIISVTTKGADTNRHTHIQTRWGACSQTRGSR